MGDYYTKTNKIVLLFSTLDINNSKTVPFDYARVREPIIFRIVSLKKKKGIENFSVFYE